MSQAPLPRKSNDRRAARRHKVSLLARAAAAIVLTAAAPLFVLAFFGPQQKGKMPAEQLPPRIVDQQPKEPAQQQQPEQTKTQTSLSLSANTASIKLCPGSPTRVRLVASGHDPQQKPPPYEWDVKGFGTLSGTGASRVWELSGVKQGVYEATVTLERRTFAAAGLKSLSDSVRVKVSECEQQPPPTCPNITVTCPDTINAGRPLAFTATLTRQERVARPSERYAWTVSNGNDKILSRRREGDTHRIIVRTDGSRDPSISATFTVTGYATTCANSCKTAVTQRATPTPTPTLTPTVTPTPSQTDNTNNPLVTVTPTTPTPTQTLTPTPTTSPTPTPSALPSPSDSATPPIVLSTSPSPSPSSTITDASTDAGFIRRYWPLLLLLALLALGGAYLLAQKYLMIGTSPAGRRSIFVRKTPRTQITYETTDENEMKAGIIGGTERVKDELQCSVFAPFEAAPGDGFIVQAFAHLAEHTRLLEGLAKEADRDAVRRGADKLGEVERGQELFFHLNMPGLEVDEPVQSVVWNGDIESVQFAVGVPEAFKPRRINCKLTVSVQGVAIGHVKFVFEVAAAAQPAAVEEKPLNSSGKYVRYRKGFVSYASEDLADVLARVQVMTQLGIECFQDVLSLKPGERWEKKLYLHIDESDVFFLFWSAAAHKSEWVEKEVRYALGRKSADEDSPPEIMPVILQGPPEVPPPSYLPDYHFNDPFALLIKAADTRREEKKEG